MYRQRWKEKRAVGVMVFEGVNWREEAWLGASVWREEAWLGASCRIRHS